MVRVAHVSSTFKSKEAEDCCRHSTAASRSELRHSIPLLPELNCIQPFCTLILAIRLQSGMAGEVFSSDREVAGTTGHYTQVETLEY
jgi:hypothetical protein